MALKLIIFFAAVILAIVLGEKTKMNYGLFAFAFVFIIGALFCNMAPRAIIQTFPTSIFFNMFISTMFYGFAAVNGTTKLLSQHIIYTFRGAKKIAPFALFVSGYLIAACGSDTAATVIFMCPIAFSMAENMGLNPLLAVILAWTGSISGSRAPWGAQAASMTGLFAVGFDEPLVQSGMAKMFICLTIWAALTAIISFFIFKGYKTEGEFNYEKPEPMNKEQKLTLSLILIVAALLIIPSLINTLAPNPVTTWMKSYLTIQSLSAICIVILGLCKAADVNTVLMNRVPWRAIIMVCGMSMLIGMGKNMGVVDFFSSILTSDALPKWAILPLLTLICGCLSFFVSGMVAIPMLMSFLPILAENGLNPVSIIIATVIGLTVTAFSPFSEGGAIILGCCNNDALSAKLAPKMFITAFCNIALATLLGLLGLYSMF